MAICTDSLMVRLALLLLLAGLSQDLTVSAQGGDKKAEFAKQSKGPWRKLYVINTAGNDVTVVDVATNKVLGRIEVGPHPHGIAAPAAQDLLLVTVEGGKGELVWIDPATDKVVRRLPTGSAPNQLAVTPDGKFAYVPVSGGNYLVVDVAQAKVIDKIFTGGQPHNTVCSHDGQRMYLAPLGGKKTVTIVDVPSRKVVGEIAFSNSVRPIAITRDEKKFFAQVDGLVGIEMADVAARKMIHRVPAEVPADLNKINSRSHGLGIRPGDKEVWDCDVERKLVHVYDITSEKPHQVASIPIGGTVYWLTFDAEGKFGYVSVRSRNEVAVVDAVSREVVARIPVGKEPKRLLVVDVPGDGTPPAKGDRLAKTRADLKSPQAEVRRAAIRSLVHSDLSEPLREEIQAALTDEDAEVRATAATAVGNLGAAGVSAVPNLMRQMQNDSAKEARETAARAIGRIGKAAPKERQAVPSLRQTADKDADPVTRTVALGALAMMDVDVPGQVVALRKFLHHDSSLVRMKAAHALGMIGLAAKAASPEIVTVLKRSTDPHERGYIARSLGNTGDPTSLPALRKEIAKETDSGARGEMNGAISRLVRLAGESDSWPQFRGPGSAAHAVGNKALPTEIGPKQYVVWKTPLPAGHSSPVIHGDRIFLTGVADKKLFTIGLDRKTGKEVWRTEAPHKVLEKVHKIGNPAQATPATDGRHVVVFFGSAGLFCYDRVGNELWHKTMGPFKTEFGAASSPLLVDGRVVLNQDYDGDFSLSVYDVNSGKRIWHVDRNEFGVGYASPVIWEVAGKKQIVQAGTLRVVGYDFATGHEIWTVRGMSRICNMTPTVGPGNILYVAGWGAGADPGDIIAVPTFDDMLKKHDANKNGMLEAIEIPAGPIKDRLPQFDRNRDGKVDRAEWDSMRNVFASAKNRMVAIRPGGIGDITKTHVLWEQKKQLPYVPSPLIYNDLIFLVKNGGLVSALDPKTGKSLKYDRVQGGGSYYSSPVGGDGKVYLLSQQGELTVISARADWEVLHTAHFGEEIFATPALIDGRIYLRTANHLYCFGSK